MRRDAKRVARRGREDAAAAAGLLDAYARLQTAWRGCIERWPRRPARSAGARRPRRPSVDALVRWRSAPRRRRRRRRRAADGAGDAARGSATRGCTRGLLFLLPPTFERGVSAASFTLGFVGSSLVAFLCARRPSRRSFPLNNRKFCPNFKSPKTLFWRTVPLGQRVGRRVHSRAARGGHQRRRAERTRSLCACDSCASSSPSRSISTAEPPRASGSPRECEPSECVRSDRRERCERRGRCECIRGDRGERHERRRRRCRQHQWQHRCSPMRQSQPDLIERKFGSSGSGKRRRSRAAREVQRREQCLRQRGSGSSLRLARCRVCLCVCVRVAGGAHTFLPCPYSEFTCCAPNAQSAQLVLESFVLCACRAKTAPPVYSYSYLLLVIVLSFWLTL